MKWLWIWLGAMNLLNVCLMGMDKRRAKKGAWRVRESAFFIVALLGGALGGWLGMYTFRHKTRHWYFKYGMPLLILLYILAAAYFMHLYKIIP